jgi:hypothetical protein
MLKTKIIAVLKEFFPVILESAKDLYRKPIISRLEKEQKEINKKMDEAERSIRSNRVGIIILLIWNLLLSAAFLSLYLKTL